MSKRFAAIFFCWLPFTPFAQANDYSKEAVMTQSDSKPAGDCNPDAEKLLNQASQAIQQNRLNEARDLLSQAERLNSKAARLWGMYSLLASRAGNTE